MPNKFLKNLQNKSMSDCVNCGSKMSHHGCTWCNEESYIVEQYYELGMPLPSEDTDFMKKYNEK